MSLTNFPFFCTSSITIYAIISVTTIKEIMSESGIIEKEDRKSVVDIYVSAESLRVYDNPWVEGMPPNVLGAVKARHPVPLICENPRKRKNIRTDLLFLGVVCLVLFVAIICLGVQMNKDRNQDICGKCGAGGSGVTSAKEEDQSSIKPRFGNSNSHKKD